MNMKIEEKKPTPVWRDGAMRRDGERLVAVSLDVDDRASDESLCAFKRHGVKSVGAPKAVQMSSRPCDGRPARSPAASWSQASWMDTT